ncbi:MAG: DUF937 domain-containing protein [Solobacterium sp.]|nr:DUF937 domain-containing protein [Solobacterium sp.]
METLLQLLLKSMSQQSSIDAAEKKTGISGVSILTILSYALPILIRFLTKNAGSQAGAQSLLGALNQHTSTKAMPQQILEADEADGQKILGHIFGDSEKQTVNEIASKSKVDPSVVLKVLAILAPVLLSSLQSVTAATANAQQAKKPGVDLSDGLDVSDLVAIFQGTQQSGVSGLLGALLGGKVDTSTPQAATDGTALLGSLLSLMGK